jgi:hypothetical protein
MEPLHGAGDSRDEHVGADESDVPQLSVLTDADGACMQVGDGGDG